MRRMCSGVALVKGIWLSYERVLTVSRVSLLKYLEASLILSRVTNSCTIICFMTCDFLHYARTKNPHLMFVEYYLILLLSHQA
jgi:hypothetical protein